jgi:hypothetical protein
MIDNIFMDTLLMLLLLGFGYVTGAYHEMLRRERKQREVIDDDKKSN